MKRSLGKSSEKYKFKQQIVKWDTDYPVDLIWRKRKGILFGCIEHKSMDFISMLFELMEDFEMYKNKHKKEFEEDSLLFNEETVRMGKKEIDEEFESLDITKYNE